MSIFHLYKVSIFVMLVLFFLSLNPADLVDSFVISPSSKYYQILSPLGSGDESIVYLAKDEKGKNVAIKRMLCEPSHKYDISQDLNHPSIIKTEEVFTEVRNGLQETFLVMEYVAGDTLRMTASNSQSRKQSIFNAYCFIDAMKYLTNKHLFHDDLHSSNIMFDHTNEIKLIDLAGLHPWPHTISSSQFEIYLRQILDIVIEILERGRFTDEEKILQRFKLEELYLILKKEIRNRKTHSSDVFGLLLQKAQETIMDISHPKIEL